MKTLEEKYKLIAETALAMSAGKKLRYLDVITKRHEDMPYNNKLAVQHIFSLLLNGLEISVKPETKFVQHRFVWLRKERLGLVPVYIDPSIDAEAVYNSFHSYAIPTVGIDGLLTFEVPESD